MTIEVVREATREKCGCGHQVSSHIVVHGPDRKLGCLWCSCGQVVKGKP